MVSGGLHRPGLRRALRLAAWPTAAGFALLSLAIARGNPAYAFAGSSAARTAAELCAGCALIAGGLISRARRPGNRFGLLLALAGFGWFLLEWNNPGIGSALGFSIGLTFYVIAPPLVAHAALAYPSGQLSSRLDRFAIAAGYAGALFVLGLLPAVVFDARAQGCSQCPANLLLVHDSPRLFDSLNRIGVQFGLVWSLAIVGLLAARLGRSTPALRRLIWPLVIAAGTYASLVAVDFAHSLGRGELGTDPTDRNLRLAQAGLLVAMSLAVVWSWARDQQTRSAIARLVVELADSPAAGGLRDALARILNDPSLQLAYPVEDGNLVDAWGRPLALTGEVTPLVRRGSVVAQLSHRPGLLDDPGLAEEVAAAARLALDNERLQAESAAQLALLLASRKRVIATGDGERRRLERDLHDGAQQRLVGFSLRLARLRLDPDLDSALAPRIDEAQDELRSTLVELRELAHGIFPTALANDGLGAAVVALAESTAIPIHIAALPDRRFDATVEATAYFVVAKALTLGTSSCVEIGIQSDGGRLVIELEVDRAPDDLIGLEDRVGALDGTVAVVHEGDGRVRLRAEIPCES